MKRHAFKTVVGVFFLALLTIASLMLSKISQRDTQIKAARVGLEMLLELQGSALNDGYFSWTELQNLVENNKLSEAHPLLEDAYDVYPLIENLTIQSGSPPKEAFEIFGSNASLRLIFGIKDDFGANPLDTWIGVATLDAQKLLDSLQSKSRLIVDPVRGRELAFGIMVSFADPLLHWMDYFLILSMSIMVGYAVSAWLWRRSASFYETKGLESIIYLFEQTERLSANHSRRVAALSVFLGGKLGYKGKRLRNLYTAALLHDIGKISVPSPVLLKQGPLNEQEQKLIAAHPLISARILKNFKELAHLSQAVLYHHERIDGSGYPEGLMGNNIPEDSRIIAVVDVFEALVGERSYHPAILPEDAYVVMRSMPLDQNIVELLIGNFVDFQKFQTPKWVLSYHHSLE
ncbi:MAG: HD domain-containing protein [Rectinemataceae bacterium]|nr:HD domain-containing protein [Rectinemataceae bacterium]